MRLDSSPNRGGWPRPSSHRKMNLGGGWPRPSSDRKMNLGAPRVGVTRGSSLFSAPPLVDGINRDQPSLPFLVRKKTTPHPCAWIPHQTALHGIGMHVLQFFSYFVTAVHVEVIKACLPETRQSQTIVHEGQPELPAGGFAFFPTQISRNSLFERLQHHRRCRFRWLADQQVHVIGHDYITHQQKLVAFANRSQRAQTSFVRESFSAAATGDNN